ncbi:MAG TPA: phage tail tube protein [Longimicrobiales bacterium]
MPFPGPTANLKAHQRRSGRAGQVWIGPNMHGEIASLTWGETAENITVPIPGTWRDGSKPGGEAGRGSFRYHDVDDRWRLFVYRWFKARREGDRTSAVFPTFNIVEKIDDIGAADYSQWVLVNCTIFGYDGGHDQGNNILERDVEFQFEEARPLHAFEYTANGVAVYAESA